ncbi:hypothetical protein [uncultured Albimonas sp.]
MRLRPLSSGSPVRRPAVARLALSSAAKGLRAAHGAPAVGLLRVEAP